MNTNQPKNNKLSTAKAYALSSLTPAFLTLTLFIFTLHSASAAETQPAPEVIFIDADYMRLNIETGYSIYTGNVKVEQGELILTGDTMTVEQANNDVEQITITGKPAHYHHVSENGEEIKADSEVMVYTTSKNTLVMTINAKLQHPDHQITSQKIIYNTLTKIAVAGDKNADQKSDDDRVKITLMPKKVPAAE